MTAITLQQIASRLDGKPIPQEVGGQIHLFVNGMSDEWRKKRDRVVMGSGFTQEESSLIAQQCAAVAEEAAREAIVNG